MRLIRSLALALALACALAPRAADAATTFRLDLGADYWMTESGVFDLTLEIETFVARHLGVGGRFGLALVTSPSTMAIPLDLVIAGEFSRFYVEGLVGPWIVFQGSAFRAHAALGVGLRTRSLSVGLEAGWLDPEAIVGVRLAFPL
jgi:hypothetical protein